MPRKPAVFTFGATQVGVDLLQIASVELATSSKQHGHLRVTLRSNQSFSMLLAGESSLAEGFRLMDAWVRES